jgi:hypothetical protein
VIPAEFGISGDKKIPQVRRIGDVARHGVYSVNETPHLFDGIGKKDSLEIVPVLQSVTDTGHNGIDIFKNGRIFDTNNIVGKSILKVMVGEDGRECFSSLRIGTSDSETREVFKGNFFGVAGTADNSNVFTGNAEMLGEVFGNRDIDVRNDSLNGREDIFGSKGYMYPIEMLVEIRRRDGEQDGIGMADDFIYIRIEGDLIEIKIDAGHISGVVPYLTELGNKFRTAHVPIEVFLSGKYDLSQSGSPTTSPHYGYFSGECIHDCGRICGKRRTS